MNRVMGKESYRSRDGMYSVTKIDERTMLLEYLWGGETQRVHLVLVDEKWRPQGESG